MKFLKLLLFLGLISSGLAHAESLKNKTDGEFVTLTGKVTKVSPQMFQLSSKGNTITVEMDDGDYDADGYKLVKGDQVIVTGRIDNDFLEKKKVEASSVYVKSLDTYFFASSIDDEGAPILSASYYTLENLPENVSADIVGKVVGVSGRNVMVDTGLRIVTVDTSDLIYNPLDDKGFTKIKIGDRVRVSGIVEDEFFGGKELSANFITELDDGSETLAE